MTSRTASAKRVLHLVNENQHRGAENVAGNLHRSFLELGIQSRLFALRSTTPDRRDDLTGVLSGGRGPYVVTAAWHCRREIISTRPDVVMAHGFRSLLTAVVACAGMKRDRPTIVWHRILRLPHPAIDPRYVVHRAAARRTDMAICITTHLATETRNMGFDGPIAVIPNHRPSSIVPQDVKPDRAQDAHSLVFAGRLVQQKRPDRFLDVAERLISRDRIPPQMHFVIAGDGKLYTTLAARIEASPTLAGRCEMLGQLADLPNLLSSARCLMLTSETESSPGVVVEAALSGCPVVAFDVDGIEDLISPESGKIVPQSDLTAFVQAAEEELWEPLSKERRQRIRAWGSRFTTERAISTYLDFLGLGEGL
jgi:glycosyltransferase involved in cell wall biosynthesis